MIHPLLIQRTRYFPRLRGAGKDAGCASIAGCCNCHSGFFAMALISCSGSPFATASASAALQRSRVTLVARRKVR